MFGSRIHLFKLFGFRVALDASWFVVALLVTWSLAASFFPAQYPDLGSTLYWAMGVLGALGLFASIVVHELGHSLVARRHGVEMRGITLFIFGGVAEMDTEPPSARAEFMVAVAGPVMSVLVAAGCWGVHALGEAAAWPVWVIGIFSYLAWINTVLVAFNLVPAMPLDGGRVLRAALWAWKGRLRWATRISSKIGGLFGLLLIALGVVAFVGGNFVAGMWWFLIGLFLRGAALTSYRQLLLRRALEGEPVSKFMQSDPIAVPRSLSVQELVEDYVYRHHYRSFPVVDGDRLLGCVGIEQIRELPRDEWPRQSVNSILETCGENNTIVEDADAMDALSRMSRAKRGRLLVTRGSDLVGVLSLRDLLGFFEHKIDLEPERA